MKTEIWQTFSEREPNESDRWADSDRGWLKVLCAPPTDRDDYTSEQYPEYDDDVPGNYRERSTLGNYLRYDHGPSYRQGDKRQYHAVCYPAHRSGWFLSAADAMAWIEQASAKCRPDVAFQGSLLNSTE
jgi:hypothetical protein